MASNNDDGCWGCLGQIFFFLVLWALIFGVTVGGSRYELGCSCDKGVELRKEP